MAKPRAARNRTLTCTTEELSALGRQLATLDAPATPADMENRILHQDIFEAGPHLPRQFVDLLILDPPYNLAKNYHGYLFREKEGADYRQWFAAVIALLQPTLKLAATIYVCSDWRTSTLIAPVLEEAFHVRNRITWEREKGRGAKTTGRTTPRTSGSAPWRNSIPSTSRP